MTTVWIWRQMPDVAADDDDLQLDDSLDMGVDIDEDFDDIEE